MDIRLVRGRRSRVWLWASLLSGGGLLVLAQGSVVAPFIYTLF